MNDSRVQPMFERSRHNNLSISIISQDYYELPKRTIRVNGNIYHIFKPNNFRYVQNLYQDKTFIYMTLSEFKCLTSTCRNEKYQPLTIGMTKDKYQGRSRLGLNGLFVPNSNPFKIKKMSIYSNVTEQDLVNLLNYQNNRKINELSKLKIEFRNKLTI